MKLVYQEACLKHIPDEIDTKSNKKKKKLPNSNSIYKLCFSLCFIIRFTNGMANVWWLHAYIHIPVLSTVYSSIFKSIAKKTTKMVICNFCYMDPNLRLLGSR